MNPLIKFSAKFNVQNDNPIGLIFLFSFDFHFCHPRNISGFFKRKDNNKAKTKKQHPRESMVA
jgi:hypothetical protein